MDATQVRLPGEQATGGPGRAPGWLDAIAISMAMLCGVHCLLMPAAVVLLPIVATSFFADENFHLWMLCFVLPTTGLAVFLGCRKHGDLAVLLLSTAGVLALAASVLWGSSLFGGGAAEVAGHCAACTSETANPFTSPVTWISVVGGLFLAGAHFRNYHLCKSSRCEH